MPNMPKYVDYSKLGLTVSMLRGKAEIHSEINKVEKCASSNCRKIQQGQMTFLETLGRLCLEEIQAGDWVDVEQVFDRMMRDNGYTLKQDYIRLI